MSSTSHFNTAEEYFEAQPEDTRLTLYELRSCIYDVAPDLIEMINYNIPAYALVEGGKRDQQIMIAGHKKHVGLYPHPAVMEHFDKELDGYKKGKGSVQFPLEKPLPKPLIRRMVKYRLDQLKKSRGTN